MITWNNGNKKKKIIFYYYTFKLSFFLSGSKTSHYTVLIVSSFKIAHSCHIIQHRKGVCPFYDTLYPNGTNPRSIHKQKGKNAIK